MSDYTQITDFSAKDALASGDPEKVATGADMDAEFAAIATAIASKADDNEVVKLTGTQTVAGDKTFSGNTVFSGAVTANTFSSSGVTITGGSLAGVTATITGGAVTGITDLAVADGGTGASTAAAALANLGAGMTKLTSGSVSDAATLDIVLTSYTAYPNKLILLRNFIPATDGVILESRVSTDGGSNYDAGVGAYAWSYVVSSATTPTPAGTGSTSATGIDLVNNVDSATTAGVNVAVSLPRTTNTAVWPQMSWNGTCVGSAANEFSKHFYGSASRQTAQDTDAVRFFFSSGNISSGTYEVYGYL